MTREQYISQLEDASYRRDYERIIAFDNEHFIPAVRFDTAMFLMQTAAMRQPKNVLEIGFGSGASSVFIRHGLQNVPGYRITTLERDNNRYVRGQALFAELGISDIELIKCDAFDWLHNCDAEFDYIFLDAVKRDYIGYLPFIKKILGKNGILIVDNTFFNDKVLQPIDELEEKYRSGVGLLDRFNRTLASDGDFMTMMYNIGDGMTVAVRR
ncbi:MAG: class I SAM-dependent methyltransferase [Spirochaetales bacterium]|nr:class I SAM-dependent methyltransferase [Spirochaetales bacterium]